MAQFPKAAEMVWLWCFAPIVALACNVVAQIIRFRQTRGARFLQSTIVGFVCGLAVLALLEMARISREGLSTETVAIAILVNTPIYAALSYCFLSFAQLGQTSIRIRLYLEIASRPEGMGAGDISAIYNDDALMRTRLRRLLESGDIVEKSGRYFVGRRQLVAVANIIFAAKHLLLARESEFDFRTPEKANE